jgi:hypothetical protein
MINGYLFADYYNIVDRWKNYFSKQLNIYAAERGKFMEHEYVTAETFGSRPKL